MSGDFFDNFNRADGQPGGGWTLSPDSHGGAIEIVDGALTTSGSGGAVGIYRPVDLSQPISVRADLTPTSGFGGLQLRFTTALLFGGDGSTDSGYGIYVYRGDQNYNNSSIILFHNGEVLQETLSTFQFGHAVHLEFTLATDGSVTGEVSSEAGVFPFSFSGFTPTYSGSNFTIFQALGDPRATSTIIQATVDNLSIDIGANGGQDMAIINGTAGDDFLIGTSGDDTITAFGGNDLAAGGGGNDLVDGGDGHDKLHGDEGDDTLLGGSGDDYLRGGLGDDFIDGGSGWDRIAFFTATNGITVNLGIQGVAQDTGVGFDTLVGIEHASGTAYADTLIGNAGDNWLWGEGGDDVFSAGDGNDLVEAGSGNVTADGGAGIDSFSIWNNAEIFTGGITISLLLQGAAQSTGAGSMLLTGFENLSGSFGTDTLVGDGGANVLAGDEGSDTLAGGDGDDTLYGDGRIIVDTHDTGFSGPITTYADITAVYPLTAGDDTLEGGLGNDILNGGGGSDTASYANAAGSVQAFLNNFGGGGASGADGNDSFVSIENVTGSAHDDFLTGNNSGNVLDGGGGHDQLRGNGGDDTLLGRDGDDFLAGGDGDDILDGGSGWDRTSFFTGATAGVTVDLNIQGTAQNTGRGMDTLVGIEHTSGTAFDDVLIGNGGDNWLWGDPTGNDTISGNGGNDLIWVGVGNHVVSGGGGIDTLGSNTTDLPSGVSWSLALQGSAQATAHGTIDMSGFENLSGTEHDDGLTGDGGANVLAGALGNDSLSGGAGDDTLYGDGRITVDTHGGGSGPIVTYGDYAAFLGAPAGDDTLEGGLGDDVLNGGGGSDTASYASAAGAVSVFISNTGGGGASGAAGDDTFVSIENAVGSAFDDFLTGGSTDNVLEGGAGHDQLRGNAGDDALRGQDGDDFLAGGDGDDTLDGGAGLDRVSFAAGATAGVTVDLNLQGVAQNTGRGMDTLVGIEHASGTAFDDVLTGDGGDNWLWGNPAGNDTLSGNGGNDLLWVGTGNHVVSGGAGTDTLGVNDADLPSGVTWSLALQGAPQATGHGTIDLSGVENLSGTTHADSLTGDGGVNLLAGGFGNDTLSGGAGNDTLYGDGLVNVDSHGNGGSGPIVTYSDVSAVLPGIPGDDVIEGGDGDDLIDGGGGTDTASYASASGAVSAILHPSGSGSSSGAAGNDSLVSIENLTGSAHDDTLVGHGGANRLRGGDGHDALIGNGGDDTLEGEGGADLLRGGTGNDTMRGGDGDDFLNGQQGDDILEGGAGLDRAAYSTGAVAGVTVDLNIVGVAQDTGSQGFDTLSGIEHVSGTRFDDVLTGDGGDNWLWGGSDGSGITGNDTISAGGGNDLVQVGAGTHTLSGGLGTDTLSLHGNGTDVTAAGATVSLALQGAAQDTEQGMMTLTGFENLSGSTFDDVLTGDPAANLLAGDAGNDAIDGGDGDDLLYGDGAVRAATLLGRSGPIVTEEDIGAAGNDTLTGGKGNDELHGGGGDDVLTGGAGQDRFVFGPGSGDDRITDFVKKDLIVFDGVAGVDDFSDLTLTASGKGTLISWGTGDSILVEGVKPGKLGASDFSFLGSSPASAAALMSFEAPEPFRGPMPDSWMP